MRLNHVKPTALPWTCSGVAGDTYIMGARAMRYEGWPNFGKPIVCEVRYSVAVEEGEANKAFIAEACNACGAVNPDDPFTAASLYPRFVNVVRALALEASQHGADIGSDRPVCHVTIHTLDEVKQLLARLTGKEVA